MNIAMALHFSFWLVLPYLIGSLVASLVIADDDVPLYGKVGGGEDGAPVLSVKCERRFRKNLGIGQGLEDPFRGISFVVHRNGEPQPCGTTQPEGDFFNQLRAGYASLGEDGDCPAVLDKYEVESLLTTTVNAMIKTCLSKEADGNKRLGFLGFCDMGPKRTPILKDHQMLVPIPLVSGKSSLPCRFHTREGLRLTKLQQLAEMAQGSSMGCQNEDGDQTCSAPEGGTPEVHLYAVPAGRVFMFAPSYVGEVFHLDHVQGADEKPISLKVISLDPRVFDIFNFFSRDESKDLVDKAIAETSDSHKIKRSSTGASGYNVNKHRTSESGFDTHGKTAVKVKKRCFHTLGFDEYWDTHGDGLQILRYNVSKAYNTHLDYIEDKSGQLEYDFDSENAGGNRFATILLYMTDIDAEGGGETVFPFGWPPELPEEDRVGDKEAVEQLRASDNGNVLEHGSWEESLAAKCRTRLAVHPHAARAVLFYSQHPNGAIDQSSRHGACPVLDGQKYAANLWVWNTPRQGYPGAPIKEKFRKDKGSPSEANVVAEKVTAVFRNTGNSPQTANAQLFFDDKFWGRLGHGDPDQAVDTYDGHSWHVKVGNDIVQTWKIAAKDGKNQVFTV